MGIMHYRISKKEQISRIAMKQNLICDKKKFEKLAG